MNTHTSIKKNYALIKWQKLTIVSILIGFLAALLAITLKHITEHYEAILFAKTQQNFLYLLIFPIFGLSVIYFLRQYLFKKKENKGIKEVFESTSSSKNLPLYKIPSHFINGLITVAFGGSTGIEVSTVVATATIGSVAHTKENFFKKYKTELICAGVAAGITALFSSPLAGILFAYEVISKKLSKVFLITTFISITIATAFLFVLEEKPLFEVAINTWHYHAIPYFLLLGIIAGMNSIYLTKCVLFFKKQAAKIQVHYHKIIFGAIILTLSLLVLPQLYGDGYHAIKHSIISANTDALTLPLALTILSILVMKPIITSITLSSGGDGGVFAPSLFIGAFLGLLTALCVNTFFNANVIPLNFMIIGMAAMLSASIHAPFTALFLVCGVVNDYTLFFPILLVCLVSKYTAQKIYPYTVYSYKETLAK